MILPLVADVGTAVALDVTVAGGVIDGSGEAVLEGMYSAVGMDGCSGCRLQPAIPTIIESIIRIRNMVFIRAFIYYPQASITSNSNVKVFWLELVIPTENQNTFVLTISQGDRRPDYILGQRRVSPSIGQVSSSRL